MILIGQGGGALGGPVKLAEGLVGAAQTAYGIKKDKREEDRQNKFDAQREAETTQAMNLREESNKRANDENMRAIERDKRAAADADWQAKRRAREDSEREAAKQSGRAIVRGLTGEDSEYAPQGGHGGLAPDGTDSKSNVPIETKRQLREIYNNADKMAPDELREQIKTVIESGKMIARTRAKARVMQIVQGLGQPRANADGGESPAVFDEQKQAQIQKLLDGDPTQGIPPADPDDVEESVYATIRESAKRHASAVLTQKSVSRLKTQLDQIEAVRQQVGPIGANILDPDAEAEATQRIKMLEDVGPFLPPSEIAQMESGIIKILHDGGKKKESSAGKEWNAGKPSSYTEADWYWDRAKENVGTAASYSGGYDEWKKAMAEQIPAAVRDRVMQAHSQGDPQGAAQTPAQTQTQPPAQAPSAPLNPYSSEGTPADRVQTAAQQIFEARQAGEMFTENEIKGMLKAARDGTPAPERTTNRNGTPRTNGQKIPLLKGAKQADDRAETERLRKKFPGAFDD